MRDASLTHDNGLFRFSIPLDRSATTIDSFGEHIVVAWQRNHVDDGSPRSGGPPRETADHKPALSWFSTVHGTLELVREDFFEEPICHIAVGARFCVAATGGVGGVVRIIPSPGQEQGAGDEDRDGDRDLGVEVLPMIQGVEEQQITAVCLGRLTARPSPEEDLVIVARSGSLSCFALLGRGDGATTFSGWLRRWTVSVLPAPAIQLEISPAGFLLVSTLFRCYAMRFPDGPAPVSSGDGEDRSEQQPPALVPIGSKPHNGAYTACVAAGRPNLVLCTRPGGRLWTCEIRPDDAIFFADLARGEGGAGDHHGAALPPSVAVKSTLRFNAPKELLARTWGRARTAKNVLLSHLDNALCFFDSEKLEPVGSEFCAAQQFCAVSATAAEVRRRTTPLRSDRGHRARSGASRTQEICGPDKHIRTWERNSSSWTGCMSREVGIWEVGIWEFRSHASSSSRLYSPRRKRRRTRR